MTLSESYRGMSGHERRQQAAFVYASHLVKPRVRNEAASILASREGIRKRTAREMVEQVVFGEDGNIPGDLQGRVLPIYDVVFTAREHKIAEKQGQFTKLDRIGLVARTKFRSGLTKEERLQMFREAGYADDEISKITGTTFAVSAGLTAGITAIATGSRLAAAVHDRAVPFIHSIPEQDLKTAAVLSLVAYVASFGAASAENVRVTKEIGGSMNALVTSLYFIGDRVLPDFMRNIVATGIPVTIDAMQNGLYILGIAQISGDPHKIIAENLTGVAINGALAVGSELWLRKKERDRAKASIGSGSHPAT
ncbi:MAG: hypothetical protein Q8Q49_01860 [bacterium]|nr:hypothetical protein [bacterium]